MPRRKPSPEKVAQEEIRKSLDAILKDDDFGIDNISVEGLPRLKSTDIMNFQEAIQTSGSDARGLIDSIIKFHLGNNTIGNDKSVEYKGKFDSMNLSSMLLQLKTTQHAITKLLEEIDLGSTNPRMFEVLAQLQSQIMQVPKDYQNYLEKMEDGYKKMNGQLEEKLNSGSIELEEGSSGQNVYNAKIGDSGGIRVRGTKGIMEGLREIIGSSVVDAKYDEDDLSAVVNARKKAELDPEQDEFDPDNDIEIDDELYN